MKITLFTTLLFVASAVITSLAAEDKVVICHRPPGNPGNVQIIEVGVTAVPTHLAHGDGIVGNGWHPCPVN